MVCPVWDSTPKKYPDSSYFQSVNFVLGFLTYLFHFQDEFEFVERDLIVKCAKIFKENDDDIQFHLGNY